MSTVSLQNLRKEYGSSVVVNNVNLDISAGDLVVLLGPSGCGKTTTLRMVAGFIRPSAGDVLIGGVVVTAQPPRKRDIGMVFQDYSLFPNMTVAENIAFGLKQRGMERVQVSARVIKFLNLIRLQELGDRYPSQLSGGQKQRVALARALAYTPRVLLMDEPFGALDLKLREAMQVEFHRIQRELGITTVLVTHDQDEAMSLADRIVIMANGEAQQVGSPEELYRKPKTTFVANFIGQTNFLKGRILARRGVICEVQVAPGKVVYGTAQDDRPPGEEVTVAIRPEAFAFSAPGNQSANHFNGTIVGRRFLGNILRYSVRLENEMKVVVSCGSDGPKAELNEEVGLNFLASQALVFASELDKDMQEGL